MSEQTNGQSAAAAPALGRALRRGLHGLLALGGLAALGASYARHVEPNWVDIEHVPIAAAGLPPALEGLRFAQISDIHLSEYFTPEQLAGSIDLVNRLGVRWLLLTGDYVTPANGNKLMAAAMAARLKAAEATREVAHAPRAAMSPR